MCDALRVLVVVAVVENFAGFLLLDFLNQEFLVRSLALRHIRCSSSILGWATSEV